MEKMEFGPTKDSKEDGKNKSVEVAYSERAKEQLELFKKSFDQSYNSYVNNFGGGVGNRGITTYVRGMKNQYDSIWLQIKRFRNKFPGNTIELNTLNGVKRVVEEKIEYLRTYKNSTGLIDDYLSKELIDRSIEPDKDWDAKEKVRENKTEELKGKIVEINSFLQDRKDSLGNDYYHLCPPRGEAYSPQDFDYDELAVRDSSKSGMYTLNPEEQNVNFEKAEPFMIPINALKEKVQNKLGAIKFAVEKAGKDYYLPGVEYAKWLYDNQDKLPEDIKDKFKNTGKYLFPGSIAKSDEGSTRVLTLDFQNNEFGNGCRLNLESIDGHPSGEILFLKRESENSI